MQLALRPWITAGVALTGASLIAVTPATSPLPNIHAPKIQLSAAEDLVGGFDPITPWVDVFKDAFTNVSTIADDWLTTPLPFLQQVLVNQIGYADTIGTTLQSVGQGAFDYFTGSEASDLVPLLGTAFDQFTGGELADGLYTLTKALLTYPVLAAFTPILLNADFVHIPYDIVTNIANAVNALTNQLGSVLLPAGLGLLGTLISPINAFGDSVQTIFDGITGGDLGEAFNAFVNIPAELTGAFLNGYGTVPFALFGFGIDLPAGGLLSTGESLFGEPGIGVINSLVNYLPQGLAQAIGWDGTGNPLDALDLMGGAGAMGLAGFNPLEVLQGFDAGDILQGFDPGMLTGLSDIPAMLLGLLGV